MKTHKYVGLDVHQVAVAPPVARATKHEARRWSSRQLGPVRSGGRGKREPAMRAPGWRMYPAVQALRCFRGFELVAVTMLVAELCDVRRFAHPRGLMAYLGLVPHEHSTGDMRRLGATTKAGNAQARWILIEAVQHASLPPKVSSQLARRQAGQPEPYRRIAWTMQNRLYRRHWHLTRPGVMAAKVKVALARELCGFVWDLLRQVPPPPESPAEMEPPVSRSATRRHVASRTRIVAQSSAP